MPEAGVSVSDWSGDSALNESVSAVGVTVAAVSVDLLDKVAFVVWSGARFVNMGKGDLFQIDKTVPPTPTILRHKQIDSMMMPQDVNR